MTIHYKWPSIRTKIDDKRGAPSRDTVPPTWFWMSSVAYSQLCGRISSKPNQFSLPLPVAPGSLDVPSPFCSATRPLMVERKHKTVHHTQHHCWHQHNSWMFAFLSNFSCWIFPWSRFHPSFYLISFFIHIVYSRADLTHLYCQCPSPKRQLSLFTRSCCSLPFHFCLVRVEIAFWQEEKHGKNCFLGLLDHLYVLQTQ